MDKRRRTWMILAPVLALLLAGLTLLMLPFLAVSVMSHGTLPTEAEAVSIRQEVLAWHADQGGIRDMPDCVTRLNPIRVDADHDGVLIIFRTVFVEDHGYFYRGAGTQLPAERMVFCKKIANGVFRYYNPG